MNSLPTPKMVACIPVLLGSTRIKDKNLILVNGKLLCEYTIEACKASGAFSEIFLYSQDDVFQQVAEENGVGFVARSPFHGGHQCTQVTQSRACHSERCTINEHYLHYFMSRVSADYVFQVNATSPLLRSDSIAKLTSKARSGKYRSLFSIREIQAESYFEDVALSFDPRKKVPSQELSPIQMLSWSIAGWNVGAFMECYEAADENKETAVFQEPKYLHPIDEFEALDIDDWSTLYLVKELLKVKGARSEADWEYREVQANMKKKK